MSNDVSSDDPAKKAAGKLRRAGETAEQSYLDEPAKETSIILPRRARDRDENEEAEAPKFMYKSHQEDVFSLLIGPLLLAMLFGLVVWLSKGAPDPW